VDIETLVLSDIETQLSNEILVIEILRISKKIVGYKTGFNGRPPFRPISIMSYQLSLFLSTTVIQQQPGAGYNIQHTIISVLVMLAFSLPITFIISDLSISCVANEIEKICCG
jgi:hypothetical protein